MRDVNAVSVGETATIWRFYILVKSEDHVCEA
jgi:hypothetical protein